MATGWQATSGPEKERDGGRCDDGDEGESGNAHCARKAESGERMTKIKATAICGNPTDCDYFSKEKRKEKKGNSGNGDLHEREIYDMI